jgi:hypothetical protein
MSKQMRYEIAQELRHSLRCAIAVEIRREVLGIDSDKPSLLRYVAECLVEKAWSGCPEAAILVNARMIRIPRPIYGDDHKVADPEDDNPVH